MPQVVPIRLSTNRRRLAKRLITLFEQIALSDAKRSLQGTVYLPILDLFDAPLQAHVTAVVDHVKAVIATRQIES